MHFFQEGQNKLGKVSIRGCYFWKVGLDVQNQFLKANYFDADITECQLPWIDCFKDKVQLSCNACNHQKQQKKPLERDVTKRVWTGFPKKRPMKLRRGKAELHVTAPGGKETTDSLGNGRSPFVDAVPRYCPIPHGKYSSTCTNKPKKAAFHRSTFEQMAGPKFFISAGSGIGHIIKCR